MGGSIVFALARPHSGQRFCAKPAAWRKVPRALPPGGGSSILPEFWRDSAGGRRPWAYRGFPGKLITGSGALADKNRECRGDAPCFDPRMDRQAPPKKPDASASGFGGLGAAADHDAVKNGALPYASHGPLPTGAYTLGHLLFQRRPSTVRCGRRRWTAPPPRSTPPARHTRSRPHPGRSWTAEWPAPPGESGP